jgi:hypothetical protein
MIDLISQFCRELSTFLSKMPYVRSKLAEKLKNLLINVIVGFIGFCMNPFAFWLDKEPPHTTNGPINLLSLLSTHREKVLQHLENGVLERAAAFNETITQLRALQINLYLAGGAFLGVLIGIIATSNEAPPRMFFIAAWMLTINIILGPILIFIEWGQESHRAMKLKQSQEVAWMLFTAGRDAEAKEIINSTIDEIKKMPKKQKAFWAALIMLKWLSIHIFFVSICLIAVSFLLREVPNHIQNETDLCISCQSISNGNN